MRTLFFLVLCTMGLASCNDTRYFEQNIDFNKRYWLVTETPSFDFTIDDVSLKYTLLLNVRNESSYPNSNLYFRYSLKSEDGTELHSKLVSEYLFDRKTGKPFGSSGIGDIYSHQFILLDQYVFPKQGKYTVKYEQFMRTDTLRGILSVGLRIDKSQPK